MSSIALISKIVVLLLLAIGLQQPHKVTSSADFFSFLKDNTYCRYNECCNDDYIRRIPQNLGDSLKTLLYGQHIVRQNIVTAINAHGNRHIKSHKPLVLSFHGTPGVGKTYVANLIVQSLFTNGLKSKFVHRFYGRADFLHSNSIQDYRSMVVSRVRKAIAECPRSVFIFDEVEQMPDGVFEGLTSLLDYNEIMDGVDNTQSMFIFISNTASVEISEQLGKLLQSGVLRDETKMSDFEKILEVAAYNLAGGLKRSSLIDSHVIDHFFPFLPLEKSHIIQCIKYMQQNYGYRQISNEQIEDIIKGVVTFEKKFNLFATSGCKRLEKKVLISGHSTEL